jgi:hypothetical protein
MKQQDGTAELVAGGRQVTVQRVASLWHERLEANRDDPEFKLTVSAPTNADAREIGTAIRAERRRAGRLGDDVKITDAIDRNGDTYKLPLAVGDRCASMIGSMMRASPAARLFSPITARWWKSEG